MITLFIAIGSYVVPNLPQFVTDSFNNILPALFGAIYVDIARKDIRAGVCGFIAGAAILFLGGKLGINNGILTVLIVLSGILINRVFFVMDKKKAAPERLIPPNTSLLRRSHYGKALLPHRQLL